MLIKLPMLPKQVLLLVIALNSLHLFAQEKEKPFRRVMIGVNFSPDVAFRVLTQRNNDEITTKIIESNRKTEIPKFGYCVGLNTLINIKSFVGVETGVWFMNMGYQTKWRQVNFGFNWNGTTFEPTGLAQHRLIDDFHYIGIPLKVNFTVGKGKLRFFAAAGLAVNFLVSTTNTLVIKGYEPENRKNTTPDNFDYNRLNIMPLAEAGIDYKINNRMNLKVSPSFRFGVINITPSQTPIGAFLFNGGINVKYYFGI